MKKRDTAKKCLLFYLDWAEELLKYPDDLRLKIDDAIKRYALYGEEPTDKEVVFSIFGLIRKQIDRDNEKWDSIKKKRAEAGRKGGLKTQADFRKNKIEIAGQNQDNPTVNENVMNNMEIKEGDIIGESESSDSSSTLRVDPEEKKNKKAEENKNKRGKGKSMVDFNILTDFFNSTLEKEGSIISRINRITPRRRKAVDARCREYGKEAIMKMIQVAAKSDFLNGKNDRGWKADFDWLFMPNNFPKVLEGNYNNSNIHNNNSKNNDYNFRPNTQCNYGTNGYPIKGKINPDCGLVGRQAIEESLLRNSL